MQKERIILGIDPGTQLLGFGIIRVEGKKPYYVDMEGFWRTLYNPDYTGSYQVAYVTSQSIHSGSWYYYV